MRGMKKIKGFIFATGFVLCGFIAGSCANTVEAGQKDFFKFKTVENDSNDFLDTYIMTDKKKGVEYIVITGCTYGDGDSVAITPRLDKNN